MSDRYTAIEAGIRPLVDALNSIPGVQTIGSCEGHAEPLIGWKLPYVYFQGPVALARHIADFLHQDLANAEHHLKSPWDVAGYFNPERGLCFNLRVTSQSWHSDFLTRFAVRNTEPIRNFRNDVETLSGLVRLYEPAPEVVNHRAEHQESDQCNQPSVEFAPLSGIGVAAQGAGIGMAADVSLALLTGGHRHLSTPSSVVTPESLSDLLVRTIHRNAAVHGEKSHSKDTVADALALTFVRLVGMRGALGFIQPRGFLGNRR